MVREKGSGQEVQGSEDVMTGCSGELMSLVWTPSRGAIGLRGMMSSQAAVARRPSR